MEPGSADLGEIEGMSFEAALAELEQIVRNLEQGQAPLDEAALRGSPQGCSGADRANRARTRRPAARYEAVRC